VGGQRPPASRRPVRARRQQLHPGLPRGFTARRAADFLIAGSINGRRRRMVRSR
jgi:hypothetical protein